MGSRRRRVVRREEVIAQFRPVAALLREVVAEARAAATIELVQAAHPALRRPAHQRRIGGCLRWMLVAEGLVARRTTLPAGFAVQSTEEQHNGGQYVFRFPGGVFTIRHQPHQGPDQGMYLQESLDLMAEADLADHIDGDADLKVFLDVPTAGDPRLKVTHPTLATPLVISLGELERPQAPVPVARRTAPRRRAVRSTKHPDVALTQGPPDPSRS